MWYAWGKTAGYSIEAWLNETTIYGIEKPLQYSIVKRRIRRMPCKGQTGRGEGHSIPCKTAVSPSPCHIPDEHRFMHASCPYSLALLACCPPSCHTATSKASPASNKHAVDEHAFIMPAFVCIPLLPCFFPVMSLFGNRIGTGTIHFRNTHLFVCFAGAFMSRL